ncbi:SDR family NAD(P)-dependent oxidoreductase [Pseudonocardia nematodicida]|uniref:SDR family NAD(P)-dependent oxidoreductase n=1 Tax=Pseudonocardia nematodicida TaxID=1206997 RepID=UPI003622CF5E
MLARNGGGALVNVLSAASWVIVPTAYAASKAAMWSASNSLRIELRPQGTHVLGVHLFLAETPMTDGLDLPMIQASGVVAQTFDGLVVGAWRGADRRCHATAEGPARWRHRGDVRDATPAGAWLCNPGRAATLC